LKTNFVIFLFFFAQKSKNFQELDKKNVRKSLRRYLFAQKRALLGNLRNFFRTKIPKP